MCASDEHSVQGFVRVYIVLIFVPNNILEYFSSE